MSAVCPQCGAVLVRDRTCKSIFDEFLVLEFTDPGYGRVHFLTVACYMIQHEGYSDEAYVWIQSALRDYLENGHTLKMIRQSAASGPGRTKGIVRPADARPLPKVTWSMTIADAAARMHDADSYCSLIEKWAKTVLQEMGPLLETT